MIKRIIAKLLNTFGTTEKENKQKSQNLSKKNSRNSKNRKNNDNKNKSKQRDNTVKNNNKSRSNNRNANRKKTNSNNKNNNSNSRAKNNSNQQKKKTKNRKKPIQSKLNIAEHVVFEKAAKLVEVEPKEGELRFTELPKLHDDILHGLQYLKFKYCTPIQKLSLPESLSGKDVVGKAQTGTGKTAAFLITLFNHILNNPIENRRNGSCRALVLAPTRELAIQIYKDAEQLSRFFAVNNLVVFGGAGHAQQREVLRTKPIDILVGTPGRVLDYIRGGDLHLRNTEMLVIDEADRMLDMGFIPDVRSIVVKTPRPGERQTMFFSATFDEKILRLVDNWLKDPIRVEDESESAVTDLINQRFVTVCRGEKLAYLLWLLRNEKFDRVMIFGNRKDQNFILYKNLRDHGVKCELLAGDVAQNKRMRILDDFKAGKIKIIIATDVAARGIHVKGVSHVINYDLPERAEDYIHRIGRTGRAGQTGESISFVCEYGAYALSDIEQLIDITAKCEFLTDEQLKMPSKNEMRQIMKDLGNNKSNTEKRDKLQNSKSEVQGNVSKKAELKSEKVEQPKTEKENKAEDNTEKIEQPKAEKEEKTEDNIEKVEQPKRDVYEKPLVVSDDGAQKSITEKTANQASEIDVADTDNSNVSITVD
ncbi:DEAD/DEAH box helicase [Lentisphaerota bacterium WC36G]|nr:DEAD/DEAH box helicase [Lentisphaerae bacterium WC36]